MAEAGGGSSAQAGRIAGLDTSVAHPARVYDYWLGGKDNFAADREAAERVLAAAPGLQYGPGDFAPEGTVSAHGGVARKGSA